MMIFIGIVLFVTYVVGAINGGWFTETMKEGNNITVYAETEEFKNKPSEEQIAYSGKLLVKIIGILAWSILMSILTLAFLIGALSVDIILIPTIILLALIIIRVVRVCTSKKFRAKINARSNEEKKTKARLSNGIYALYVLYILVLLIA